ncbi:pentapeptide repeat-containing protein [Kitasatospora sp. NPDC057936]|uniref:pentapeptide repeat-containing protein n=1 Tax=Kitasatospora sp. NPDC057936 TaxID=3346283 RepID=UPI0036DC448B
MSTAPASQELPHWEHCGHGADPATDPVGCRGIHVPGHTACLAHIPDNDRDDYLADLHPGADIDHQGTPFTGDLLSSLLQPLRDPATQTARIGNAGFNEATFSDHADFDGATFSGDARFERATFSDGADFSVATFSGLAAFSWTTFSGGVWFNEATFSHGVRFHEATFSHDAGFGYAAFPGNAWFDGATFTGDAWFDGATFSAKAHFRNATFSGKANFDGAMFSGDARFGGAIFRRPGRFERVRFEQTRQFGPLLAHRGLMLDEAQFMQPVQIEVSTIGLSCRRARFPGGVQFRLRWARVVLDDADFPAPSILTGIPQLAGDRLRAQEQRIARAWQRLLAGEFSERPQLLSLRRANVAGLGLSNVIAADCLFSGAHNLDKLRLEADVGFTTTPQSLDWRQVIAEERSWRAARSRRWAARLPRRAASALDRAFRSFRWAAPRWPKWFEPPPGELNPGQTAALYRALRKGREDAKDEPGAADFYYGEMEMRRCARPAAGSPADGRTSRGQVEHCVLTAYWLVSGYGLRAWRALAWLIVVTAILALVFHLVGFTNPPQPVSYWTSLLYALRATLSLTDSEVTLTAWGKLLQAVLRVTGPVLLSLALLALRGRVKR